MKWSFESPILRQLSKKPNPCLWKAVMHEGLGLTHGFSNVLMV